MTAHPQERLLLAGERRLRQVLGGRARADGDGACAQAAIGIEDGLFQQWRDDCLFEPGPNQSAAAGGRGIDDVALELIAPHRQIVRVGSDHEPLGNRESRVQQLAQVGGFAATPVQIPDAKSYEIDDKERLIARRRPHLTSRR